MCLRSTAQYSADPKGAGRNFFYDLVGVDGAAAAPVHRRATVLHRSATVIDGAAGANVGLDLHISFLSWVLRLSARYPAGPEGPAETFSYGLERVGGGAAAAGRRGATRRSDKASADVGLDFHVSFLSSFALHCAVSGRPGSRPNLFLRLKARRSCCRCSGTPERNGPSPGRNDRKCGDRHGHWT